MARLCVDLVALPLRPVLVLAAFGLGDVIGRRRFAGIGGVLRELGDRALQRLDLPLRGLPLRIELAQVRDHALLCGKIDRLCLLRGHRRAGGGNSIRRISGQRRPPCIVTMSCSMAETIEQI